jgi:hypothetical protein
MRNVRRVVLALFVAAGSLVAVAQQPNAGPPAFITFPILTHVAEAGLDHGHFVFGPGETAVPAPIFQAPPGGSAGPAQFVTAAAVDTTGETNVSRASDSYEGETSGSATPTGILVGFSNHIYPGACSAAAAPNTFGDCAPLAYSSGNGVNWTKQALPRTWNGTTFGIGFDPGVDFDKSNRLFYSYGVAPLSRNFPNAVVVASSTDGINFTQGAPVTFNRNRNFDDKYYLAIDRSNNPAFANRIYVSWDRNSGNNQTLLLAFSSNGGASWSTPVKVNDGTTAFERVIGAYPAVDQNSSVVYDSWHDYAKNIIFVDRSTNGGVSWGTDVAAATTHAGFGTDIGCVGGRSQGPAHALKVGPTGALYLVYADQIGGGTTNKGFDILLVKSTDGGAHWSAPITLNDDTGASHQFHPTLSVESNGAGGDKITVSFYDRRDDPANCLSHVYSTQSTDGGVTWTANTRRTSAQSDFDGNPNGPGDYSSSTPGLGFVFPFFGDHRAANPETAPGGRFDIYTVRIQ